VTLSISRAGVDMTVPVALKASPKLARDMARYEAADLEFRVRDLASTDDDDPRLRGVTGGVIVESVSEGGWAALARLRAGDIIQQVDGRAVATVTDLSTYLQTLIPTKPRSVVFQVRRGVRTLFVEMKPEW
jgi:S1-C subfamily serine protease